MVLDHLHKELRIYTDGGRCSRPLFKVEKKYGEEYGSILLNEKHVHEAVRTKQEGLSKSCRSEWKKLLNEGVIEYVDADEEEMSMIAMFPKDLQEHPEINYTHCEMHPSLVLGISGGIIPFCDHNQCPRNVFQCAMGKQAIGVYASSYQLRMETLGYVLFYPQKPLVATNISEYVRFGEIPAGINSIVAICCYSGYNQEDSLIINQSSIDRGFFRSISYKSYPIENDLHSNNGSKSITKNAAKHTTNEFKYKDLDNDGIVCPGTKVNPEAILANAVHKESRDSSSKSNECPLKYSLRMHGVVDTVTIGTNSLNNTIVKVKVRTIRIPQIGDKFSSRHGQKGTCGMTYRQEDMPFNIDGISPDIIMNPHAIPSRMTVAQLVECLLGKVGTLKANTQNGTPFNE